MKPDTRPTPFSMGYFVGGHQVPQHSYMLFDTAPPAEGLAKKLREFNDIVRGNSDLMHLAMTDEEIGAGGNE